MRKRIKRSVWWFVKYFQLDKFLAKYFSNNNILRKAIPPYSSYAPEQFDFSLAPNLKLSINRSDYTQWRVFAGRIKINKVLKKYLSTVPNFIMADIGANVGAFVAHILVIDKSHPIEIHFFEPNPYIFKTLQINIANFTKYNGAAKCIANQSALGEKEDDLILNIPNSHSGASSLHKFGRNKQSVSVHVTSLDKYVQDKKLPHLHFLKLDVEAFEPAVFHGAYKTLTEFRPMVYFEYSRNWARHFSEEYIREVFSFLASCGYSLFLEQEDDRLKIINSHEVTAIKFANLFALQPHHIAQLEDKR